MKVLPSYLSGAFQTGTGAGAALHNPATEAVLARASSEGLDIGAAVRFARDTGGPALRAATFAERGKWLAALAASIHSRRDALIDLAIQNGGNTRGDAKFDIDGATATLTHYAELGTKLGLVEVAGGEPVRLQDRLAVEGPPLAVARCLGEVADDHVRVQVRVLGT